jgi:hypothetical protein
VSGRPLNPNPGIIIWPPSSLTLPTSHRPPPSRASLFPHVPPLSLALDSSLARRPPPSRGGLIPHAAFLPRVAASFLMPRSRASLTHHHLATPPPSCAALLPRVPPSHRHPPLCATVNLQGFTEVSSLLAGDLANSSPRPAYVKMLMF